MKDEVAKKIVVILFSLLIIKSISTKNWEQVTTMAFSLISFSFFLRLPRRRRHFMKDDNYAVAKLSLSLLFNKN